MVQGVASAGMSASDALSSLATTLTGWLDAVTTIEPGDLLAAPVIGAGALVAAVVLLLLLLWQRSRAMAALARARAKQDKSP